MTDDSATTTLLRAVFPGARTNEPEYLRWLYRDSPFGEVVEANLDDEQGRAGHYAIVPCDLQASAGAIPAALSLNTAVSERARGDGLFTRLAESAYAQARAQGVQAVIGVANANSTPGFVRRLGFTLLGPLPASVLVPLPSRGAVAVRSSAAADGGVLGDPEVAALLEHAMADTASGVRRRWTPETLAWRLASPATRYVLHRAPGLLAVSTVDCTQPVPVAVLLMVVVDHDLQAGERAALVRAVCRAHRAPVALHVGHNRRAGFRGVPLPDRLRPSPLNLIFRWLDDSQLAAPRIDPFEFLDFDPY